jgi:hypothetical protein
MIPTREEHQIFRKSRKKCSGDPGNDETSVCGRKHGPYTESPKSLKPKQVKSKVKGMLINFFDIKANVHKEFVLENQTVNSSYYCDVYGDCVKMCEDIAPNFGDKRTGCCITTTHHLTFPFPPGTI